jgi:hypothetical protein
MKMKAKKGQKLHLRKDCKTLERSALKNHQFKIDQSQGRKLRLMERRMVNSTPIE